MVWLKPLLLTSGTANSPTALNLPPTCPLPAHFLYSSPATYWPHFHPSSAADGVSRPGLMNSSWLQVSYGHLHCLDLLKFRRDGTDFVAHLITLHWHVLAFDAVDRRVIILFVLQLLMVSYKITLDLFFTPDIISCWFRCWFKIFS